MLTSVNCNMTVLLLLTLTMMLRMLKLLIHPITRTMVTTKLLGGGDYHGINISLPLEMRVVLVTIEVKMSML